MDTKTFTWVISQLRQMGYMNVLDELERRWRACPSVQQDEAHEQEEWDRIANCGDCGRLLELVRPGKYQCNHCEDHREWERVTFGQTHTY